MLTAEADVVGDGAGEEERVLQDDSEAAAECVEVLVADVDAVDEDLAVLDVVEAHHQRDDGGLAGAGVADDGGGFAGGDGEGDAAEDPFDVGESGVRRSSSAVRARSRCAVCAASESGR